MPDVACKIPEPLDYKKAKATYAQVRKDTNYKLSPEANAREAARRLGTDLATVRKVLATKGKAPHLPSAATTAKKPIKLDLPDDPYDLFKGRSGATHSSTIADAISMRNITANKIKPVKMKLDAGDVIAGQDHTVRLSRTHLRRLLNEGIPKPGTKGYYDEARSWAYGKNIVDAPMAVKIADQIYMINGHHRMITAKLLKQKVDVDVYDISGFVKAPKVRWNAGVIAEDPVAQAISKSVYRGWEPFTQTALKKYTPAVRKGSAESEVIRLYTEGMARYFNFVLRSGDLSDMRRTGPNMVGKDYLDDLKTIERMMVPLDRDAVVYRGINAKNIIRGGRPALSKAKGNVYTDKGFMSTTVERNNAVLGQGTGANAKTNPSAFDTVLELRVPKGVKALYTGKHSAHSFEKEMILQRGLKFRIKDVFKQPDGRMHVIAEVIK